MILVPGIFLLSAIGLIYSMYRPYPTEPPCELGRCDQVLVTSDSGKSIQYPVGTRFFVYLNGEDHPEEKLTCVPLNIVKKLDEVPHARPPFYYAQFEAAHVGTCELRSENWRLSITIQ